MRFAKKLQMEVARQGEGGFAQPCFSLISQRMPSDSPPPPRRRVVRASAAGSIAATQTQPAARRGYRRALGLLGLFVALAVGRLLWREVFVNQDRFALREIVVSSQGPLSPAALVEASALSEGMNLLSVDLGEVAQRLEALPAVRQAEVVRDLRGRLTLRVQQREPLALLLTEEEPQSADEQQALLVDASGHAFAAPIGFSTKGLPLIRVSAPKPKTVGQAADHAGLPAALRWVEICRELQRDQGLPVLREVRLPKPWRVELHLQGGMQLLAGVQDLEAQRQRLQRLWAEIKQQGWKLQKVDLATPHMPARFAKPPLQPAR